MASAFAQVAVVKDHDAVAFLDGGQAVSDDHRGAAFHHAFDGLLDELLGLGVDRAGRFVKDQDRWVERVQTRSIAFARPTGRRRVRGPRIRTGRQGVR